MMAEPKSDETLREMAEHRGLKLVRSRRRKPGSGDYGKYGLTDAGGKPLLGIGAKGLDASAADIEAYLRGDAAGTWKASADSAPARAPERPKRPEIKSEPAPPPARPNPRARPHAKHEPEPKPEPEPAPKPPLAVRAAKPADAASLMALLRKAAGVTGDPKDLARNLAASFKAPAGLVVAERGNVVGACAFVVIPTIQSGPVGRLTLLLVDEAHRRSGTGTALVEAAAAALGKAGCTSFEAMSDIAIDNAHGFFRALNFEQASYRFVRVIEQAR